VASLPYPPAVGAESDRSGPALLLVEPAPIRVLIADAQPVVRAGLASMLGGEPDIGVAGVAGGAEEAVALATELRPDVVLVDLDLPRMGGLEVARRITDDPNSAHVGIVILAADDSDEHLFAALRSGALGFVLKSTEPEELAQAVRVVAGGEALLSPSATRRLIAEFRSQPQPQVPSPGQLEELTARELEVMALVASGLRNHEIAERFVISPATVKTHVSRALRKLHARDRSQLVAIAYQLELVHPPAHALRSVPSPPLVSHQPAPRATRVEFSQLQRQEQDHELVDHPRVAPRQLADAAQTVDDGVRMDHEQPGGPRQIGVGGEIRAQRVGQLDVV
jgi:DNA-binding NarL/FixJ family response regulator